MSEFEYGMGWLRDNPDFRDLTDESDTVPSRLKALDEHSVKANLARIEEMASVKVAASAKKTASTKKAAPALACWYDPSGNVRARLTSRAAWCCYLLSPVTNAGQTDVPLSGKRLFPCNRLNRLRLSVGLA